MTLTASIVLHRTPPAQLRTVMRCLLAEEAVERVYLVDNSPDDSLRPLSLSFGPRAVYMRVDNRGYGAGHNEALRRALLAGTEYHLVLNADVCWEGSMLAPMLRYMSEHPEVGMMQPRIIYPDGALQLSARMLPGPFDLLAKRFLPQSLTRRHMERYLLASRSHDEPFDCPYLCGSFLLMSARALRETGIFDERFFMYPEDIDITRRMHRRFRTLYWPLVTVTHVHAAASRRSGRMLRIHLRNMARYFSKYGWLRDPERRALNRRLLAATRPLPTPISGARG